MSMTLYELAESMNAVINGGLVYDPDTGEVLFDSSNLEALEEELDHKLEACGVVYKNIEAEAEAIKAEIDRLKARYDRKRAEADRLKDYVLFNMERTGAKKIDTARVCMTTRRSTYLDVQDAAKVPSNFVKEKVTTSIDKTAVTKAIKAGDFVPGCELRERTSLKIG